MKPSLGRLGEKIAADHLLRQGYLLLKTNWHCPYGELDLILRQGDTIVFVEVKTRRGDRLEEAFLAITPRKRAHLIDSAEQYLSENGLEECAWRIDVVAVAIIDDKPQIEHVEDALGW